VTRLEKYFFIGKKEFNVKMKMNLGLGMHLVYAIVCRGSLCDEKDFTNSILERWLVAGLQFSDG